MALPFERDLGYLAKFFDTLEGHAASMESGPAGVLKAFVADERKRWADLQAQIGSGGTSAPAAGHGAEPAKPAAPGPLTVGSLISR